MQDERKSKHGNLQVYAQSFIKCLKFLQAPSDTIQTVRGWSNSFQKDAQINREKSWNTLAANGRWLSCSHFDSFSDDTRGGFLPLDTQFYLRIHSPPQCLKYLSANTLQVSQHPQASSSTHKTHLIPTPSSLTA